MERGHPGPYNSRPGPVLAAPSASPHRHRFQKRDKALLCGTHGMQGACSQQQKCAALPLNVASPPFNQPPDSFKSGWVGGAVKPQPIKSLMSCRFLWMKESFSRLEVSLCSVPRDLCRLKKREGSPLPTSTSGLANSGLANSFGCTHLFLPYSTVLKRKVQGHSPSKLKTV